MGDISEGVTTIPTGSTAEVELLPEAQERPRPKIWSALLKTTGKATIIQSHIACLGICVPTIGTITQSSSLLHS